MRPRILLLDEPFGALDAKVRKDLRRWLRRIHDEMGLTTIFVTHDQEEALELADRVVVMSNGRIEQVGAPDEVYDAPATPFVCEFIGQAARFDCVIERDAVVIDGIHVPTTPNRLTGPGIAYVRSHDFELRPGGAPGIPGKVRAIVRSGPNWLVDLETVRGPLEISTNRPPRGFSVGADAAAMPTRLLPFADGERASDATGPAIPGRPANDPGSDGPLRSDWLATAGSALLVAIIAIWLITAVTFGPSA